MIIEKYHITTIDNPFDPITNFQEWFSYDTEKGFYSCSRIERLCNVTDEMSSFEEIEQINQAIDRLIELDPINVYKKVIEKIELDDNDSDHDINDTKLLN